MSMTLKISDIAPGILRLRLSEKHARTLAERYKLIELPETLSESGIKVDETAGKITFPDGRIMSFSMIDGEEYDSLHESLEKEFEKNYTDYQAIIGAPEEEAKKAEKKAAEPKYTDGQVRAGLVPADSVPENAHFAVRFSILPDDRFYGLGEASRDRVELRGRAYQNWVRYQYNEISVPFLSSDGGYGFLVNANRRTFMDIGGREKDSLIILGENDEMDIFVFAGEGLYDILPKYTLLSGRPMLLPKWAYGLTYIAPIFGTQHDVLSHAERFRKEHIPCDMFSLEPGWMKKFYDYSTKKEWATERFHVTDYMVGPNSDITFISALKRYGFHLALWICIRHDLTGEAERELARLNDPQYNAESDTYGESWYEHLKKFTDLGIAGYKLDPADMVCCFDRMSRPTCRNGLSPMTMHDTNQTLLARQMYLGYSAQTGLRPMIHYCGGFTGTQRWCAATTGDNGGELGAMIWLETLAMTGFMNTTIDMNIHHPESIHFGMFVPWAHLNAWHGAEQPWWAGDKLHRMFVEYARMRYRILPYIYSAALEGHEETKPIVRPMVLEFPDDENCRELSRQYMFGGNLLVSAYADSVYLPAGRWTDAFTGEEYVGPATIENYKPTRTRGGGLFIRGGAVIPNWSDRDYSTQKDDETIALDIWPDENTSYVFREDDGVSLSEAVSHTLITLDGDEEKLNITIGSREGDYAGKPERRTWLVRVHSKPGDDRLLSVKCAPEDRVFFTVRDGGETIFDVDASDVIEK